MTQPATARRVDDGELTALLARMHDRRDAVAQTQAWAVTGEWRSFKADFVKASGEGVDIAVKFGDGWTEAEARFVANEVERVHDLFAALPAGPVVVPRSLGWSGDPGAVAMPFVEAAPLFRIFGDRSHPLWRNGDAAMRALAGRCGQAIGAYHAAQPGIADPATERLALDDLLSAARRAGVRRATILEVEPHLLRARGYRFSPNDLMVDDDGRLIMLDPPHVQKYDYLPRDVSAFTFELHKAVIGEGPLRPDDADGEALAVLRTAFLEGYAATGPTPLDTALERWVLRIFEISRVTGLAYSRLKRRVPHRALPLLRWAFQLRRGLGKPPGSEKMSR